MKLWYRLVSSLPNFLLGTPTVAATIWATGWVLPDAVMATLSLIEFLLLIVLGVLELMILYRQKKVENYDHDWRTHKL